MNVLVLISGIVDPKYPVSANNVENAAAYLALPRKLSPFDESALECALKLRDAGAAQRIHALVAGSPPPEPLLRTVAAFRLDRVSGLSVSMNMLWDASAFGRCLAGVLQADEHHDLVLMGREFGDFDEGLLAPCLAEGLHWPFVGLAQHLTRGKEGELVLWREREDQEESLHCTGPVLASITNDKRNRLRYPLMKNIAAAKKERLDILALDEDECEPRVSVSRLSDAARPAESCRMLSGNAEAQAAALAGVLLHRA